MGERVKSIIGASGGNWKSNVPRTLTQLVADIANAATTTAANLAAGLATKVNLAGDTMTGKLTVQSSAGTNNNLDALDLITTGAGNSGVYFRLGTPSGVTTVAHIYNGVVVGIYDLNGAEAVALRYGESHLRVYSQIVYDDGNLPAAVLLLTAGSANNALALGTVGPTGWARRNAGSYVGNNVGQSINVGFQARLVLITSNEPANYTLIGISTAGNKVASGVFSAQSGVHIDSGNTFSVGATAEANDSTKTYQWVAYS
jgi:hypothetical protein